MAGPRHSVRFASQPGPGPARATRPAAILPAVDPSDAPYYGADLALVHHRGFGSHADACAPGILALLEPVRAISGIVLEVGCGSGHLTRHLVAAGHRVIATDASPGMLDLVRGSVPGTEEVRQVVLPDDPLPAADAVVSVGHVLNYLPDEAAIEQALVALAEALRPSGILAIDLCDVRWAEEHADEQALGRAGDDWALVSESSVPRPGRYVRDITVFVRTGHGSWRRSRERHVNVLVDTSTVPRVLDRHGVTAAVQPAFGEHTLPAGLVAITGARGT